MEKNFKEVVSDFKQMLNTEMDDNNKHIDEIESETKDITKKLGDSVLSEAYQAIQNRRIEALEKQNNAVKNDLDLLNQLK